MKTIRPPCVSSTVSLLKKLPTMRHSAEIRRSLHWLMNHYPLDHLTLLAPLDDYLMTPPEEAEMHPTYHRHHLQVLNVIHQLLIRSLVNHPTVYYTPALTQSLLQEGYMEQDAGLYFTAVYRLMNNSTRFTREIDVEQGTHTVLQVDKSLDRFYRYIQLYVEQGNLLPYQRTLLVKVLSTDPRTSMQGLT